MAGTRPAAPDSETSMKIENPHPIQWQFSERAQGLQSSFIREILKITQRPEIISFAGGLPSPATFPVERMRAAYDKVLSRRRQGRAAIRPDRRLRAAARMDRQLAVHRRHEDPARADPDGVGLAAGARPDRQGADRRRQPRAGRNPELPGRAAGLLGLPPGVRLGRHRRRRPGALLDRRRRQRRAPAVFAAELPEPDRPLAVGRAPPRTGGNLRPPRPAADRGRSLRRAVVFGRSRCRRWWR